jgi:hypothetical protein
MNGLIGNLIWHFFFIWHATINNILVTLIKLVEGVQNERFKWMTCFRDDNFI